MPADKFKECDRNSYPDCPVDLASIVDHSYAAWVKQQLGDPNSDVVVGLFPDPGFMKRQGIFDSWVKAWENGEGLELITNTYSSGNKNFGVDPAVDAYFKANSSVADDIVKYATKADSSYLDGAALGLRIGAPQH